MTESNFTDPARRELLKYRVTWVRDGPKTPRRLGDILNQEQLELLKRTSTI